MAKKLYNGKITQTTDWGGDESTGGLPVSGARVQEFIKETLDNKLGYLHYDEQNNRYLVFTDKERCELYLSDPTGNAELLLGTFDAPFNYSIDFRLETPAYNAVFSGSKGHYIDFSFDVRNKNNQSTGDNLICTYHIRNGNETVKISETYGAGRSVHFNLDAYLKEGTNNITIEMQGQQTLATTSILIVFQMVRLSLTDNYNIGSLYRLPSGENVVAIPYTVDGYGTKIMEWYVDGVMLEHDRVEDEIVEISSSRIKYISVADKESGLHNIQFRVYTVVGGDKFYSDTLYRDVMLIGNDTPTLGAMKMTIPSSIGILSQGTKVLYGINQFIPAEIECAAYSPLGQTTLEARIDGVSIGNVAARNKVPVKFSFTPKHAGASTFELLADGLVLQSATLHVEKTQMNLAEITNALVLDFTADGKSNYSGDKNSWTYGRYSATFGGFKWNATSGWNDGTLMLSPGSSFEINYKPFGGNTTQTGKTIELEFMTTGVEDDGAVLLDLTDRNGTGLRLYASKAVLTSAGGKVVQTEFKSDEMVRLGFVINPKENVTNKRLTFIYVNGILSRAVDWVATDSYANDALLRFIGSDAAQIHLRNIRIYDTALSADQMLNNYTLSRPTIVEMKEVYERNNIYTIGSNTFDTNIMGRRLPVMIVTGNIPLLENTSDKNLQITVDIEYRHHADPNLSFKMKGAAMRPQGTSSMAYPKKNFRIYTKKLSGTVLYDGNGKIVEDKLYSFKQGAQPVHTWCMKADYAESSGTHNTGVARLWNDVMKNALIDGERKLLTQAQKAAENAGYPYDVRTTVDGFPILMFYRLTEKDPLIFIGKYNFNNDKSTESVFGFRDIPGFDNSRMQCWEILNNGHPLSLFTDVSAFDTEWQNAFEGRYPDGNENTIDLKGFCQWMASCKGNAEKFKAEKWEHLDVYKVAAYYVYLMRFGAVDQTVKNAMFTSEDGVRWFYINYDNDTVNGLINSGPLRVPYDADRQTKDTDNTYFYAGHESALWNMLEADEEFIQIVAKVDNALYQAGLRYDKVIEMFDTLQADKWVERVYNQDALYKYIGPFVNQGINNLFMLQGKRDIHRKYWLARRFQLFDAKFVSGEYKSGTIEVKCLNDTPAGQSFTITSGTSMYYGYGINNIPRQTNVRVAKGEDHTFTIAEVLNLGDVVRVYAAPNLSGIDFSAMMDRIAILDVSRAVSETTGARMKRLVVGSTSKANNSLESISGLSGLTSLEYLDVRNCKRLKSLDLTTMQSLKTLYANNSGIVGLALGGGAPLRTMTLPSTIRSLRLEGLHNLEYSGILFDRQDMSSLSSLEILDCPNLTKDLTFVNNWINGMPDSARQMASLTITGVALDNITASSLINLKRIGSLTLSGHAKLSSVSQSDIDALMQAFGENVLNPHSDFYITGPEAIFITGDNQVNEGESVQFKTITFPVTDEVIPVAYSIVSGGRQGVSITADGLLTTIENGLSDTILTIRAQRTDNNKYVDKKITIRRLIYPQLLSINGSIGAMSGSVYSWVSPTTGVTGRYTTEWILSGELHDEGYVGFETAPDGSKITLVQYRQLLDGAKVGDVTVVLKKTADNSVIATASKAIQLMADGVIMTSVTNPEAMAFIYRYDQVYTHFGVNENYLTQQIADQFTSIDKGMLDSGNGLGAKFNPTSFDELQHFRNLESISALFYNCRSLVSVRLPESLKTIGSDAFFYCTALTSITLPERLIRIGGGAFCNSGIKTINIPEGVTSIGWDTFKETPITSITIPEGVTEIEGSAFQDCRGLASITLPSTLRRIGNSVFDGCYSLTSITFPEGFISIGDNAFARCSSMASITLPSTLRSIGEEAFNACGALTSIVIPQGVTYLGRGAFQTCRNLSSVTINEGITSINYSVFYGCIGLTSITIPASVTSIGVAAFYNCSKLTSITIPASVTSIGASAFYNCSKLTSIIIPEGVTSIGSTAFSGCTRLTSITIPTSVTSIGESAFGRINIDCLLSQKPLVSLENCFSGMTFNGAFSLPEGVTSIGKKAFCQCKGLTSITIPTSVTNIGESAFRECSDLKSVVISEGVTSIGEATFYQCTNLSSINIPESVTSIGSVAFSECTKLTTITIPEGITSIGAGAFQLCFYLATIKSKRMNAPSLSVGVFGSSSSSYTGYNSKANGNVLIVPANSTGYDTGQWLDPLCNPDKCGFTLQKTL